MELKEDYYDIYRNLIAKKGSKLTVISDHQGVLIVETEKGLRFAIRKELIAEEPTGSPNQ